MLQNSDHEKVQGKDKWDWFFFWLNAYLIENNFLGEVRVLL